MGGGRSCTLQQIAHAALPYKPFIYAVPPFLHKDLHKNSKGYEKKWQTKMNETLYDLEQKRNAVELDIQALYETLQKEIAQTD